MPQPIILPRIILPIHRAAWRMLYAAALCVLFSIRPLCAQPPSDYDAAWLRYARIEDKAARERYATLPAAVVALGESPVVKSAQTEIIRGMRGMLGRTLRGEANLPAENAIVLGTYDAVAQAIPAIGKLSDLRDDGFVIRSTESEGKKHLVITAHNDRGVLYGAFSLLRRVALEQSCDDLNEQQAPYVPLRVLNQHDRLDGSVLRGYAGSSLFWEGGHVSKDLERVRDFARLLASVGINAVSINDPAAGSELMEGKTLPELVAIADALRPWGLRLVVATDMAGIRKSAGIPTGIEFNKRAAALWTAKVEDVYKVIPDLAGFVVTADAEPTAARPPIESNQQEAPAAEAESGVAVSAAGASRVATINRIAAALAPHAGVLFYRIPNDQAPSANADPKHDPGMTAFLRFHGLDGQFDDNVVLQIPAGAVGAQLRQPPSPLFGALEKTHEAIEFNLCQQFAGQQRHLCFLVPAWKSTLDFDMHAGDAGTPVKKLVAGRVFKQGARGGEQGDEGAGSAGDAAPNNAAGGNVTQSAPLSAFVIETNAGRDANWLRHPLAMANLYGFGRLAWNPELAGKAIAEEWGRLTFGHDPLVVGTIVELLLESWQVYESYTGPLGVGSLTDHHTIGYGPNISSSESAGTAPLHGAVDTGVGVDRSTTTGTGFVAQYRPTVAKLFDSLATTPDDLVLFMHHVPYTHKLKSGRTVIQHIYNSHYEGARDATRMVDKWQTLEERMDEARFRDVLVRLNYQAGHARVWRDAVSNWFLRKSGIADDEGRVGNWPNRFEAESMQLEGYEAQNVTPWETASGGQCAASVAPTGKGSVNFKYEGEPGWFDLSVCYFDENDGAAKFQLSVAGEVVDEWLANDTLPDNEPNGHTSTRHVTRSIALRKGDEIRIGAAADGGERAAIDYLEINAVKH